MLNKIENFNIVIFKRLRVIFEKYQIMPPNGKRYTKTYIFKFFLMFGTLFSPAIIGNFFNLWRISSKDEVSLPSTLECIYVNAELMAAALTGFVFLYFGNDILEFLQFLGVHKFDEPEALAEVYEKHDKITNYLFYSTKITILGRIALNLFENSFCEAKEKFLDERYFCGMMLPCWFPFRMNIVAKIWIFATSSSLYALCIPVATMGYFFDYGISDLIVLRMKKMKQMLKQLDFRRPRKMIRKQLVECIEYHSEIWNLVKNMNNSVGWCHACQYSLVSGIIACIEYELIVSPNVTSVFQLSIYIIGEFMICSAGQNLENEREAMATALYMTPFYELPVELSRTFAIFLAKMQVPLHFEAKPIIHLNYGFFMLVFKSAYTLVMFLQNVNLKY